MEKLLITIISGIIVTVIGGYLLGLVQNENPPSPAPMSVSSQSIQSTRQVTESKSGGLFGGSSTTSITETSNVNQTSSGTGTNINISSNGDENSSISINISGAGQGTNINVNNGK